MKKLISSLLATVMILSVMTVPAFAATSLPYTDEDYLKEDFTETSGYISQYRTWSDGKKGVSWPEGTTVIATESPFDPYAGKLTDMTATTINFPTSTVILGVQALSGRKAVTSVNFTELTNLKFIDTYAFKDTKITSVDLRNTQVVRIGRNAFETANNIKEFYASPTLKVISAYAFGSYSMSKVELNEGLERLESQALPGRGTYTNVILPKSLTYIASDALRMEATYKVYKDSYAEQWCKDNKVKYTYVDGSGPSTDPTTPPTTPTTPPKMENTKVIGGVTFSNVVSHETKTNSVGRTVHFVNITQNGCMRSDSDNTQFYYIHYGAWPDYKNPELSVTTDSTIMESIPTNIGTVGIIPYKPTKNANGTWSKGLTWQFSDYSPNQYNANGYSITTEINGMVTDFSVRVVGPTTPNNPSENVPTTATANPTTSKVIVNGKAVAFDAYNINNNNYFKLRDIAQVVRASEKQFEVTWNAEKSAIELVSFTPYTTVGGELKSGDGKAKTATLSTSPIFKDGKEIKLVAYNINGNNYFKLRDLGESFNFNVTWDGTNNAVVINTIENYSAE